MRKIELIGLGQATMSHVRLSKLVRSKDKGVASGAVQAADIVADAGGSPRAQIDAARKVSVNRLTYNAHIGSRQAQRNLARLAKKFLPCEICQGIEGCDHSVPERRDAWEQKYGVEQP